MEVPQFFQDMWLLLWLLWSILWLVDMAKRIKYDWLLQLSDYRCHLTANFLMTLSDYNCTKWLAKNKAPTYNAPIKSEETVMVTISLKFESHTQTTTPGATFPNLCVKSVGPLMSHANQCRKDAGDRAYCSLFLSDKTRMSNHLQT